MREKLYVVLIIVIAIVMAVASKAIGAEMIAPGVDKSGVCAFTVEAHNTTGVTLQATIYTIDTDVQVVDSRIMEAGTVWKLGMSLLCGNYFVVWYNPAGDGNPYWHGFTHYEINGDVRILTPPEGLVKSEI